MNMAAYSSLAGVDALGLDTAVPLTAIRTPSFGNGGPMNSLPLQGNLDPLLLLQGGIALDNGISEIKRLMAGYPHIFNLGHGVSQHTNPYHVARLVEMVKSVDI